VSALPFVIVMVGLCFAVTKDLRSDPMTLRSVRGELMVENAVIHGVTRHGDDFDIVIGQHAGEGGAAEERAESS
jgi:choline-glycine betaine transporter